jgi:hypothetical protein
MSDESSPTEPTLVPRLENSAATWPRRGAANALAGEHLLLGIVARQNDLITRDQLVAGFGAWIRDRSRPLADVLADRGALADEDRALLLRLVARRIARHGGDIEQSLGLLRSFTQVREDLERLDEVIIDVESGEQHLIATDV